MPEYNQTAAFIAKKRKENGLTQKQLADRLHVSCQAVSKWEKGLAMPGTDSLVQLAGVLGVSVDALLQGNEDSKVSYSKAGVDISYTDAIKTEMEEFVSHGNPRVLNRMGAFASLYDFSFPEIKHPVLVLKAEEPGSKQKLAIEYGYTESICHDMINHLVNDIAVMNGRPLAVLDTIICGKAEKDTIKSLVKGISDACRENECVLIGGETSIQPQVVDKGIYVLTSTIAGVVDKEDVIDGSRIAAGDRMLAVASNGLHTNGYSLVRMLMEMYPEIKKEEIDGEGFIEYIMRPHTAYYPVLKRVVNQDEVAGMAHITGGGIEGNVRRIIPDGLCAEIDLAKIKVLPIFHLIRQMACAKDQEMLSTFNCGVGLIMVVRERFVRKIMHGIAPWMGCYEIGVIREAKSEQKVDFVNALLWK